MLHRRLSLIAPTLTLLTMCFASSARAAISWTGLGTNDQFANSGNYDGSFGSSTDLVFSDGSVRDEVNFNSSSNRDHNGSLTFSGDSFRFYNSQSGTFRHLGGDFTFNTANTITVEGPFDMRRPLSGSGSGKLIMDNVRTQNSNFTFGSAATVIMNENRSSGFTGPNETRTVTLSDTVTVVALQGAVGGNAGLNINAGATLAGMPTVTPGVVASTRDANLRTGGRLSPGDNYHTFADVGTMAFTFGDAAGRLNLEEGSLFTFDLDTPGTSDLVNITAGGLTLDGQEFGDFTFNALAGFGAGTYTLFDSVLTTGTLGANLSGTVGGLDATLSLSGNDVILTVIPEPASLVLMALGTTLIASRRRG